MVILGCLSHFEVIRNRALGRDDVGWALPMVVCSVVSGCALRMGGGARGWDGRARVWPGCWLRNAQRSTSQHCHKCKGGGAPRIRRSSLFLAQVLSACCPSASRKTPVRYTAHVAGANVTTHFLRPESQSVTTWRTPWNTLDSSL